MNNNLGNKAILALNLKHYMELKGVDRQQLSHAIGVPYTTITDWIKGKTYPRIDKIEMMARFFGITKPDLIEAPTSSPAPLHPAAARVAEIMEDLNEEGVNKIIEYAEDISTMGKYKKCDPVSEEEMA